MQEAISLPKALARGFAMKCPNCGRGHLFGRFLKVADHCEVCGEDYTAERADDFPAYLVIVIVGHIVVPALLAVAIAYDPPAWLQLAIWLPVTLFASLGLLQPVKGTIVALQWQTGMHGFEQSKQRRERLNTPAGAVPARVKVTAHN
jgi:uncharacterized protein (DUF983 family)